MQRARSRVYSAFSACFGPDPKRRPARRKELADIYDVRSTVVHGVPVDTVKVRATAKNPTELALAALRASYRLGRDGSLRAASSGQNLLIPEEG